MVSKYTIEDTPLIRQRYIYPPYMLLLLKARSLKYTKQDTPHSSQRYQYLSYRILIPQARCNNTHHTWYSFYKPEVQNPAYRIQLLPARTLNTHYTWYSSYQPDASIPTSSICPASIMLAHSPGPFYPLISISPDLRATRLHCTVMALKMWRVFFLGISW